MIKTWVIKKILRCFDYKDFDSVNSLVFKHHINPNVLIPEKGVSLLHLIIGHQSESFAFRVTKFFLTCGGDPNVQSSDGVTPTHVAAAWGRNRILHLLLVNGGNPWMQDDEKKNAFNYAFEEREWATIEMLHHFQRMHSAPHCKQDFNPNLSCERNLQRGFLRKREDMIATNPPKKSMKSMMTQTQCDGSDVSSSPVQDKIRYFEPNINTELEVSCQRETETVEVGWLKDFYQTSCDVLVHGEPRPNPEKEMKETFISSIRIPTPPLGSDSPPEKSSEKPRDVRGQLFAELQEAVRRRSRLRLQQEEQNYEDSVLLLEKDSFVAKEASYLYGVDLEENGMLKNMSDFATKVMNEIEVAEDQSSGKTIDLCSSGPDLTTMYLSCEEEAAVRRRSADGDVRVLEDRSATSNMYLTLLNSQTGNEVSKEEVSTESFVSVSEEYKDTDAEEAAALLQKNLVVTPTISLSGANEETAERSNGGDDASTTASSVPSSLSYNSDVLRCELNGLGFNPGPVTKTTKKLYLKKLRRLKKQSKKTRSSEEPSSPPVEFPVSERRLAVVKLLEAIPRHRLLEEEMCRSFENSTYRKWREGRNKTSFNYLLLDPRVSLNLPKRSSGLPDRDTWTTFLSAIFYVGKGKRSRPYAHLHQATAFWEGRQTSSPDERTKRILEIWREGLGVVCLHVFQNIIPAEAFTREAAMIDALGLHALKNAKAGEYYGVASAWSKRDKIHLGAFLLHKAMLIFVNEGERQIRPYDID